MYTSFYSYNMCDSVCTMYINAVGEEKWINVDIKFSIRVHLALLYRCRVESKILAQVKMKIWPIFQLYVYY